MNCHDPVSVSHQGKVDFRCPQCGSRNVVSDATAQWNVNSQSWELCGTYDCTTCQDCDYDADSGFELAIS